MLGTTAVPILPSPYELLMKKGVTRTKVHLRAALKYCTLSCNCTKLVNSGRHAASGSYSPYWLPSSLLLLQPQSTGVGRLGMGINADSSSLTDSTLF